MERKTPRLHPAGVAEKSLIAFARFRALHERAQGAGAHKADFAGALHEQRAVVLQVLRSEQFRDLVTGGDKQFGEKEQGILSGLRESITAAAQVCEVVRGAVRDLGMQ